MKENAEKIRGMVAKEYARAISQGTGCRCPGPEAKELVTRMAGYRSDELLSAPPAAVGASFGCGNPVGLSDMREGETVLDLGSGGGLDLVLAAERVGPTGKVIGVDMTPEMVAKAREEVAAAGLANVEVRQGLIEELPVEGDSVDWVISNCVLNLSPQKERVFAEIARVLRPGGRMLVADLVAEGLPEWARENQALYCACVAGAVSEERYLEGLRAAGLVEVEVQGRLVYDAPQLRAFLDAELIGTDRAPMCSCGGFLTDALAGQMAEQLAGKVRSVAFSAKKPSG